jgi:hypothetical protein
MLGSGGELSRILRTMRGTHKDSITTPILWIDGNDDEQSKETLEIFVDSLGRQLLSTGILRVHIQ